MIIIQGAFNCVTLRQLITATKVLCIAMNPLPHGAVRLAVGLRGCVVVGIDYNMGLQEFLAKFHVNLDIVPRCVAFAWTTIWDIYVLGLEDGKMWVNLCIPFSLFSNMFAGSQFDPTEARQSTTGRG